LKKRPSLQETSYAGKRELRPEQQSQRIGIYSGSFVKHITADKAQEEEMNFQAARSIIRATGRVFMLISGLATGVFLLGFAANQPPATAAMLPGDDIPALCAKPQTARGALARLQTEPASAALPPNSRSWAAIPSVIRSDGVESFRLEVNVNSDVSAVRFVCPYNFVPESGGAEQTLRDDGMGGDRVAGDRIFTSVPMRWKPGSAMSSFYRHDTNSPAGLEFLHIDFVKVVELNGSTTEFLIPAQVGLLHASIPLIPSMTLSSNVIATLHLLNIRSAGQWNQRTLRALPNDLHLLTQELYAAIDDTFDFLIFFTTDHVEQLPRFSPVNFTAGSHLTARVNYTGTGQMPFDGSSFYMGRPGRLLSINILDAGYRGIYSANATHEILHQWLVYTAPHLGLDDGTLHYNFRSSAASLLGAYQFVQDAGGRFIMNCQEGRSGAHFAPPLDRYMAGLIEGSAVPPILFYSPALPPPLLLCDQELPIARAVTIQEIQEAHGVRQPGPVTAQRDFAIGFVAETQNRFLTPTELTFYDRLAAHYTRPVAPSRAAPYVGENWVPVTRFFGEGVTWTSHIPSAVQPRFASVQRQIDGSVLLSGTGFPTLEYTVQSSSNLTNWTKLKTVTTGANGTFQWTEPAGAAATFYRLFWLRPENPLE
jgi:hypothetical protein